MQDTKKNSKLVAQRYLQAVEYILKHEINGIFSKQAIAEQLGEYYQNFYKMQSGDRYPTLESIYHLHDKFNVSLSWLFTGSGTMFTKEVVKDSQLGRIEKMLRDLTKDKK